MPPTLKKLKGHIALDLSVRPSVLTNGPLMVYSVKIIWDLLGTYTFLATFSKTVSTQQEPK